jgi:hypothetical protein
MSLMDASVACTLGLEPKENKCAMYSDLLTKRVPITILQYHNTNLEHGGTASKDFFPCSLFFENR